VYNRSNVLIMLILFAAFCALLAFKSFITIQVRWMKLESQEPSEDQRRPLTLTDLDEARLKTLRVFTRRVQVK
jgi:hypothetical protein